VLPTKTVGKSNIMYPAPFSLKSADLEIHGGSNMTGTDLCVNKPPNTSLF
jgi:hypothetical protein